MKNNSFTTVVYFSLNDRTALTVPEVTERRCMYYSSGCIVFRWEKLAMKSRSLYLKHRSQKMLKDRLGKYCVAAVKARAHGTEKQFSKKVNQSSVTSPSTVQEMPTADQSTFSLLFI